MRKEGMNRNIHWKIRILLIIYNNQALYQNRHQRQFYQKLIPPKSLAQNLKFLDDLMSWQPLQNGRVRKRVECP